MQILVVEDEAVQARVLRTALQKRGHRVTLASDGVEAWELIQQDHFSLVISDWLMPRMTGLELCRNLRRGAVFPYTYVILLTAKATREDRLEGLRAGADDFPVETRRHGRDGGAAGDRRDEFSTYSKPCMTNPAKRPCSTNAFCDRTKR